MKVFALLGAVLALVGCSDGVKTVKPTNLASGGSATFADLFGIDEQQASRDLSPALAQCLMRAHEDFSLALNGKEPRHAKSKGGYSDGGTSLWEDPCFTLVVYRQLSLICENGKGLSGAIFGPELRLRPSMAQPERAAISRTRFVTMETGIIEGAEYSGCAP